MEYLASVMAGEERTTLLFCDDNIITLEPRMSTEQVLMTLLFLLIYLSCLFYILCSKLNNNISKKIRLFIKNYIIDLFNIILI